MITVVIGPMGAGKSTEIIRRERRAAIAKQKCVSIKYAGDNRYSDEKISTHDKTIGINAAILTTDLADVVLPPNTHIVIIDEAQFIKNMAAVCARWIDTGVVNDIVIAMLNADYSGRPFDNMGEIIAMADNVIFLSAVCALCGGDASRTVRLSSNCDLEVIGGFDIYSPRCRPCAVKKEKS